MKKTNDRMTGEARVGDCWSSWALFIINGSLKCCLLIGFFSALILKCISLSVILIVVPQSYISLKMESKFSKEEREKFMRELESMGLESDSEFEDSFFQKETKRMQSEIAQVKQQKDQSALQELKRNMKEEDQMMTEYQRERQQLHQITSNQAKNVIDETVISEIKNKVQRHANNSSLVLADQLYNQSVITQQNQPEAIMSNASFMKVKKTADQKMKKIQEEEERLRRKIEQANQQREYIGMQQEDKLSYQFEMQCLSNLFKERFLVPKFPKTIEKDVPIKLSFPKLPPSYVRLAPQIVSDQTVLPRNAPQIALKQLKKYKTKKLKPSSSTQIKVTPRVISSESTDFQETGALQENPEQKDNKVERMFRNYIQKIKPLVSEIERVAAEYNPRFLRYLREEEKNLNFEFEQKIGGSRSLKDVASLDNGEQLCELKLSFEKLTSLDGIEVFRNLQECQFQFNLLKSIDLIAKCPKLIQINVSNNRIRDISSISNLKWLRLINLQHNLIEDLSLSCQSLQIVMADHNRLQRIQVNQSKKLRILKVSHNRLHQLPQIRLLGLQQLDISSNQLQSCSGIQNLILLKKLNISNNRIQTIDFMAFLYLNEFNLSSNGLKTIDNIFLPCLEELRLNNNKIETRGKGVAFLPNLKEINIDDNHLQGFGSLWWLLSYSRGAEVIRYGNNQYFLSLREKVREVYQAMLYKEFNNLKILNDAPTDSGLAQYYKENYSIYFDGASFFKETQPELKKIQAIIRLILRQSTFSLALEEKNDPFSKQQAYIDYQWKNKVLSLREVMQLSEDYLKPMTIAETLFFRYDLHQNLKRRLFHLLRGVVVRRVYKKQKRLNHFKKIKPKVSSLLNVLSKQYGRSQVLKSVLRFGELIKGLNKNQAALKIQKVWRGYIRRKLYNKLRKRVIEDDSDIEDVDVDFFNNELEKVQFDVDLQQFEDIIIRPEVFEILQKKNQEKKVQIEQKGKQKKQQKQPLKNNFLDSRTKLSKPAQTDKKKEDNDAQKLMKEWRITDPRVLKALQFKQHKKDQMKRKEMEKNMTAAERYERFKRGGY